MGQKSTRPALSPTVSAASRNLEVLPDDLIHPGITALDVAFNRLTDLPSKLGNVTGLRSLKLQGNRLDTLPKVLFRPKLCTLEALWLDRNVLTRVPNDIGLLLNLTQLILSRNQLTTLPDALRALTKLELLDVSSNRLALLPDVFGEMKHLQMLRVSCNQLHSLPPSVGECTALQVLHAQHNRISALPASLGQCRELTSLDASYNFLEAVDPAVVGALLALRALHLDDNRLEALPLSIGHLTELRELRARSNRLRTVPAELAQLVQLRALDLGENLLKALPPKLFVGLTSLTTLDLTGNMLTELPSDLSGLTALNTVVLTDNRKLRSLPVALWTLPIERIIFFGCTGLESVGFPTETSPPLPTASAPAQTAEPALPLPHPSGLPPPPPGVPVIMGPTPPSEPPSAPPTAPTSAPGALTRAPSAPKLLLRTPSAPKLTRVGSSGLLLGMKTRPVDIFQSSDDTVRLPTSEAARAAEEAAAAPGDGTERPATDGAAAGAGAGTEAAHHGAGSHEHAHGSTPHAGALAAALSAELGSSPPHRSGGLLSTPAIPLSAVMGSPTISPFPESLPSLEAVAAAVAGAGPHPGVESELGAQAAGPGAAGEGDELWRELYLTRADRLTGFRLVPAVASTLSVLTVTDAHLGTFPPGLAQCRQLRRLRLVSCDLTGPLPPWFIHLASLEELALNGNPQLARGLRGAQLTAAFEPLGSLSALGMVLLAECGLLEVPEPLNDIASLVEVDLSLNAIESLPPLMFCNWPRLHIFDASFNRIKTLPYEGLRDSVELTELRMSNNLLTTYPPELDELHSLELILLDGNPLVGRPPRARSLTVVDVVRSQQSPQPNCSYIRPSPRFPIGYSATLGHRPYMEDGFSICGGLTNPSIDLVGIYDGHAGTEAMLACVSSLPAEVALRLLSGAPPGEALTGAFEAVNTNICRRFDAGCVAVVALLMEKHAVLANAGDCRAIAIGPGQTVKRLTRDHKALDKIEAKALAERGGFLSDDGRLNGVLMVSRAFGDRSLRPAVTACPEISTLEPLSAWSALVLACDGVWDVLSDECVAAIVHAEPDPTLAARRIRDAALFDRSGDNITVVVVRLDARREVGSVAAPTSPLAGSLAAAVAASAPS